MSKTKASKVVTLPTAVVSSDARDSVTIYASRPLAMSLDRAAQESGLPTWTLNEAILLGDLKAKQPGRQRIILTVELERWLTALDDVAASTAPSILKRAEARQ